jgi:hypothetical protein
MSRFLGVAAVLCALAKPSDARPRLATHAISFEPRSIKTAVNTHTLYLNQCANGCMINPGTTNSTTNTSDIVSQASTLSAFNAGSTAWSGVVSCVKSTMSRFNIQVVDTQPTSGDYFEVMVAGLAQDLNLPADVGGIADYACNAPGNCIPYISDALVFDFANVWQGNVDDICATAAQEIAHAWSLDHVVDASDPMTYNEYSSMRSYHDNEVCGSDCTDQNGVCQGPFGAQYETCSGTCGQTGSSQATHTCMSTGTASQNEVTTIMNLFGPSGAVAPTLSITSPANNAAVQPGFAVNVSCTSSDGIQEVDLSIDNNAVAALTTAPYTFETSPTLGDGPHTLSVMCSTELQATATATANVVVGTKCSKNSDCPSTDVCYDMACIAGPGSSNGLGTNCTTDAQCASNACASDGTMSVCVVPCNPSSSDCPSGFGCLNAGSSGVCWPGADNGGGGGCDTGRTSPMGPLLLAFGIIASWFTLRRPVRRAR